MTKNGKTSQVELRELYSDVRRLNRELAELLDEVRKVEEKKKQLKNKHHNGFKTAQT
jgi:predicted  nucleic acid-binding Zn-ribbon protein